MKATLRSLYLTLRFLVLHPVSAGRPWVPLLAFARWQLRKRLRLGRGPVRAPFVNASEMLVDARFGDSVGVLYTGLPEFWEMGFTLHLLRAGDLFVDCGANVGTYSIAAATTGAACIAIEPVPTTFAALRENVALNGFGERIGCLNVALGRAPGMLRMTAAHDSGNHVLADSDGPDDAAGTVEVPSRTLDDALAGRSPTLVKFDVEGYESTVLDGAARVLADPALLAVIVELNGSGERFGVSDHVVHERMLGLGFTTFSYSAITRELVSLDRRQSHLGNTIYARREAEVRERLRAAPPFTIRGTAF